MQLIRGLHNVRACHQGCAVTIGNFDGCHLGHQALLKELKAKAREYGVASLVVTFEPHPREFLQPKTSPPRLTSLREKVDRLAAQGVEAVLIVRFDKAFSKMSAEQFVEEILVKTLRVRFLLVGSNFRFGFKRQGDTLLLKKLSLSHNFEVAEASTYDLDGTRVSSTWVRKMIGEGQCERAKELLGDWYSLYGRVIKGRQLGRQLGFPTINIPLKRLKPPLQGIFVVRVYGVDPSSPGCAVNGVASIGTNPTVGGKDYLLEVFLLPMDQGPSFQNLYGRILRVEFIHYLREERRLESLEALKQQIEEDVCAAKRFLMG